MWKRQQRTAHPCRELCATQPLTGAPQFINEHDFPSGSETRRKGRPVITGRTSPSPKAITFSLTRGRIFGNINLPRLRYSRLRPACDPPLKAGFVFLGSRLLANHLEHSA